MSVSVLPKYNLIKINPLSCCLGHLWLISLLFLEGMYFRLAANSQIQKLLTTATRIELPGKCFKRGKKKRWYRNTKAHWNTKRCLPKSKQNIKKQKISSKTNKRVLNCYVFSKSLYGSDSGKILGPYSFHPSKHISLLFQVSLLWVFFFFLIIFGYYSSVLCSKKSDSRWTFPKQKLWSRIGMTAVVYTLNSL